MSASRFVLTTRAGRAIRNPIDEDLRQALDEVFDARPLSVDDAEAVSAWLRFEHVAGTTLVIEVCQDGTVFFDQWADAAFTRALFPPAVLRGVSEIHALALWRALRAGDVAAVRCEAWQAHREEHS